MGGFLSHSPFFPRTKAIGNRIADNLNSSVITRVINLDYGSARESAKVPKNKQEKAYRTSPPEGR
jgi:hypothetical protein